ncbi:MAG: tRNA pseudouridine(38-40) synthase TruA [Candidatus Omnitrophota bacterium]|jgi:tRNA pseudouridine38-40 synthase
MRNVKLTVQYDGTHYAGWQTQKNAKTVQEVIEKALRKITGEKVNLTGSGRTDSGVHARAQVANFRTRSALPLKNIQMALNSILPKDIVISGAEEAGPKFSAQHSAKSKVYRYTIANGDFVDPFIRRFAAKCFYKLDMGAMKRAASVLCGKHDFRSFQAKDVIERGSVRTIKKITIEKDGYLIYIDIEANGFLYNMARNIAGTLIEVARGKIPEDRVKDILLKKDRRLSGPTAPAQGLCLMKVKY